MILWCSQTLATLKENFGDRKHESIRRDLNGEVSFYGLKICELGQGWTWRTGLGRFPNAGFQGMVSNRLAALGDAAMMRVRFCVFALGLLGMVLLASDSVSADEPNWQGNVIARGAEREKIESTPILDRPYRPLHFYGNTVRRRHYRGTAVPTPRDLTGAAGAVTRGR